MECVLARNLAAMAVSVYPTTRSSRRNRIRHETGFAMNNNNTCSYSYVSSVAGVRVRCGSASASASAGSESCLAPLPVKEDFADEEDYIKAGGSELMFVQMQQNKRMDDLQSKLSDKVMMTHEFYYYLIFLFLGLVFTSDVVTPESITRQVYCTCHETNQITSIRTVARPLIGWVMGDFPVFLLFPHILTFSFPFTLSCWLWKFWLFIPR